MKDCFSIHIKQKKSAFENMVNNHLLLFDTTNYKRKFNEDDVTDYDNSSHLFFDHFTEVQLDKDGAETSAVDKKRKLCNPIPSDKMRKEVIIHNLLKERKRLANNSDAAYILNVCLELVHDYDCCGYKKFKKDFDEGKYYDQGRLYKGNEVVGKIIGEVSEYVSPVVDVERIIDKYIKAIAILERWKTVDDFIYDWDGNVFTGLLLNEKTAHERFLFTGFVLNRYIGWENNSVAELHDCGLIMEFQQVTTGTITRFWNKARMTVQAMSIVDRLDDWSYYYFDTPFDFDLNDD
jgi:hypothetical protein